jgi:NitT/TauT family transport system ATP-binding protein
MGEERRARAIAPARPRLSPPRWRRTLNGGPILATISVENVSRSFTVDKRQVLVLDDVTFDVPRSGVCVVLGPNGSGKSTLLRLIAGLIAPDSGRVLIGGQPVADADQRVGFVFQEPRLLPWRTALDNVCFPLELAGVAHDASRARAGELLDLVGVGDFGGAYPRQLSGGMRQRVAIARALVRDPEVLLLDEPFSALDALTRDRFDDELLQLWQRTGTTIVLVTHSIPEAVYLADEVVVLSKSPGRVVARVPVSLERPRSAAVFERPGFTRLSQTLRSYLAGSAADSLAEEAAGAPVHDVLDRAGTPAFFDPWGGR